MNALNFSINYPTIHSGTDKSIINFYNDSIDLYSVFYSDNQAENSERKRFFVTDSTVATLECVKPFIQKFEDGSFKNDTLLILGSGEKYKTIESVLQIVSEAVKAGLTRKDTFIGIGGGVICDITAFAASIFKRGASVEFVPTTLLSMVDASIGGKSGCDFENCKNIIGTFFPAKKLYYFPQFVQYLSENQYNSGLAEAFKTALLADKELYELFKNESEKINKRDPQILQTIIQKCVKAKADYVEKDFTEQNIRAHLNLGHTFGHALESVAGFGTVTHGYAVAWGIGRCLELSYKKDLCMSSYKDEVLNILKMYNWETNPIPDCIKGGGVGERLIKVMHSDKKNQNQNIKVIMQKDICNTVIEECTDSEILSVLK